MESSEIATNYTTIEKKFRVNIVKRHETKSQHLNKQQSKSYFITDPLSRFIFQQWEMVVLDVLGWDLSAVTPYSILDHLLRTLDLDNVDTVRRHAETFNALAATEHTFLNQSPDVVALACLAAALRGLNCNGREETIERLESVTGVKKVRINNLTRVETFMYLLNFAFLIKENLLNRILIKVEFTQSFLQIKVLFIYYIN
jgi:transcription initiation factor TFIIIB Brf1 subunit/transcription initiation factor TFIIB